MILRLSLLLKKFQHSTWNTKEPSKIIEIPSFHPLLHFWFEAFSLLRWMEYNTYHLEEWPRSIIWSVNRFSTDNFLRLEATSCGLYGAKYRIKLTGVVICFFQPRNAMKMSSFQHSTFLWNIDTSPRKSLFLCFIVDLVYLAATRNYSRTIPFMLVQTNRVLKQ